MKHLTQIYTDGACEPNPGYGGWGMVCIYSDGTYEELGGSERDTTNNRMEMQAVLEALLLIQKSQLVVPVKIYSDSKYTINGVTEWCNGWKRNGWKRSKGGEILNLELWKELDRVASQLEEKFNLYYIKGHAGHKWNEPADQIAGKYRGLAKSIPAPIAPVKPKEPINFEQWFEKFKTKDLSKYSVEEMCLEAWSAALKIDC